MHFFKPPGNPSWAPRDGVPRRHSPPGRGNVECLEIAAPEKNLELVSRKGFELGRRCAVKPAEATGGEPLVTEPEALTVVDQEAQCRALPVAEDKDRSRKGVRLQLLSAGTTEAVDPLAVMQCTA
jgi:hypothetical protein